MEQSLLIADSGSSKTDWIYVSADNGTLEIHTAGINPVRDSQCAIALVLREQLLPALPCPAKVSGIRFYGAGCIPPYSATVADALAALFPQANLWVESDLLGAARALCGHEPGIACILGTGSNSCLYDGTRIVAHTPPLGYVLGDEGSGAVLGRNFLSDLYKGLLPTGWVTELEEEYQLTMATVIDHVYRQPQPNRFLASMVPFIARHVSNPLLHDRLVQHFRLFLQRNVAAYGHRHLPVHCVGGIAHQFAPQLHEAMAQEGFLAGKTMLRPIGSLAIFHSDCN